MQKFRANNRQGQQLGSAQGFLQGNGSRKSSLTRNALNGRQPSVPSKSGTVPQMAPHLQSQGSGSGAAFAQGQPQDQWVKHAPLHQAANPQQVAQTLPARAPGQLVAEGRRDRSQPRHGQPPQPLAYAQPPSHGLAAKLGMVQPALAGGAPSSGAPRRAEGGIASLNKQMLHPQGSQSAAALQNGDAHRRGQLRRGAQTAPQRRGGAKGKATHSNLHAHLYHEYLVQCTVREAKLSKDLSTFWGQMSVFCEVKFQSTSLKVKGIRKNQSLTMAQELAHSLKDDFRVERSEQQTSKVTQVQTGQTPKWEETFTFKYQKLSKACLRLLNRPPNPLNFAQAAGMAGQPVKPQQNNHQEGDQAGAPELPAQKSQSTSVDRSRSNSRIGGPVGGIAGASGIPRPGMSGKPAASAAFLSRERGHGQPQQPVLQNSQRLDFCLFRKTMLFAKEKIGAVTLHMHNCDPGGRANWLVLTNDNDDEVGKLLVYVEIKRDTTQRQLRLIQKDLNMQDQVPKMDDGSPDAQKPGMNIDMTEDKGMPLRNHEQVLLLNDRQEPQSNQQSSNPPQPASSQGVHLTSNPSPQTPQTQVTQITHVTHQTQNSSHLASGLGGVLQAAQAAQSNLRSIGGPNGRADGQAPQTSSTNGPATSGQQNRVSSSLIMGATNVTNVTSTAANCNGGGSSLLGGGLGLGPLYLETTNIIPNNKLSKKSNQIMMMHGSMISVMHKDDESEDDDDDEDEYGDEDDEYGDEVDYGDEYPDEAGLAERQRAARARADARGIHDPEGHYEHGNDIQVAQIMGTGGNLQTHCREEDEDDEIDSAEEGADAAPAARDQKNAEAERRRAKSGNTQAMQGGGALRTSQLVGRPPRDAFGGANITEDSDSSQLLMGGAGLLGIGMGVVETQQIREDDEEEADDDEDDQANEPQDQYEEYAGDFELGMTRDTPQAVEGGGPSQSTGQNTHGNSGAPTSSHNTLRGHSSQSEAAAGSRGVAGVDRSHGPGQGFQLKHQKPIQQPQRVDPGKGRVYQEIGGHQKAAKQPVVGGERSVPDIEAEEDDESNINSDEQDEYLECVPGQASYQNFASNDLEADDAVPMQSSQYSKHAHKSTGPSKKHSDRERPGGMLQFHGYPQRPQTAQTTGAPQRLMHQQSHPSGYPQPPFSSSNSLHISQNYHSQMIVHGQDQSKLLFARPHHQPPMGQQVPHVARSQTFQQDEHSFDQLQQQHYQHLKPIGAPNHQMVGPGRAQTSMAQRRYANQNFRTAQGSQHSGPAPLPRAPPGQAAAGGSHPPKQGLLQAQTSHGRANRAGRNKYIDINTIEVEPSFRQRKSIFQQTKSGTTSLKQAPQSRSKDRIVMRKKVMPISNTPGTSLQNLNLMSSSMSRGGQSGQVQVGHEDGRLQQKKNSSSQRRGLSQNKQAKSNHAIQDPGSLLAEPQLDHHSISYQPHHPSASMQRLHHQQSASHNPPPIFSQMPPNNRLQQSRNRPGVHAGAHKPAPAGQKQRNPGGIHAHAHTQHTPSHHLATQTTQHPSQPGHLHGAIKSTVPTLPQTQMHTQLYTQEAQHHTHWTNHTNGEFGDFNMGEIDDEDLLQNQDDYDDEYGAEHDESHPGGAMRGQTATSDDQYEQDMGVCSEGDEERYERDQVQDDHVRSPAPFKQGRLRAGDQSLQGQLHGPNGDHSGQNTASRSKKKRRQPSQEPAIGARGDHLVGPPRLPGDVGHHGHGGGLRDSTGSRGSAGAGAALGGNPLEQETFSMQHDTFQGQADGAEQQDFGSQPHGMYPQLQHQLPLEGDPKKGYSRERTGKQAFVSGPAGQIVAGFGSNGPQGQPYHGSASSMGAAGAVGGHGTGNNQVSLYQSNAKQAKMMNRRKKIEEAGGQYPGQYMVGQGMALVAPVGYSTNHQHGFKGAARPSQLPHGQYALHVLDHGGNNVGNGIVVAEQQMDHSVIQHGTSQSQTDSDELGAPGQLPNDGQQVYQQQRLAKPKNKRTQQHHPKRDLMHEHPDGMAGLVAHPMMAQVHGNAMQQSAGIHIGGATLQQYPLASGPNAMAAAHGKKSRNPPDGPVTLIQQYNTYQECRDGFSAGMGGFEDESREEEWTATSGAGGAHMESADALHHGVAPHQVPGQMKRPNGPPQQNPQSILNSINSQNSRAMSHEFKLNEMHKSISDRWDQMKRQKAELKRERARVAEEAKALQEQRQAAEAKAKQLKAKKHQVKRERLMVNNEAQKIKVLHQQFADLLQTQQSRGAAGTAATVEVSEKLGSIKMMLELLLNDREAMKGGGKSLESTSSDGSKGQDGEEKESDDNGAEKSDTVQSSVLMPSKKTLEKRQAADAEPSTASKDRPDQNQLDQIVQGYQARLEEMYQARLEEMKQGMQTMQNMLHMQKIQMMNNQMSQNISQFNRMHSQMASITTASHLHNHGLITPTAPADFGELGPMAGLTSAQKESQSQHQQQATNYGPQQHYQAAPPNIFAAGSSMSQHVHPQGHLMPNSATSPLSSTLAFHPQPHSEHLQHPMGGNLPAGQHFALYTDHSGIPQLSDENMENMRDYFANFGKSQQMELPDKTHDGDRSAPGGLIDQYGRSERMGSGARNDVADRRSPDGGQDKDGQAKGGAGQAASAQDQQLHHAQSASNAGGKGNDPETMAQAKQGFDPQRPLSSDDRQQPCQQDQQQMQDDQETAALGRPHEAAQVDNNAQDSSSQSEFIPDPDPDFLNKINQNIRLNNGGVGGPTPPPFSQLACFGVRNNGGGMHQQREEDASGADRAGDHGQKNSEQADGKRKEEGPAQRGLVSAFGGQAETNERMDLISRGSDVQIEAADVEDIMPRPGVREAAARNQQSVIEQAGPTQSFAIHETDHGLQLDGQRAKHRQDGLQQHANTDRNSTATQFKENLVQGTQGDFVVQRCQQAISAESSNSQIPSSQMSAFQSIQQRLKLGMNQNANVPLTSQDLRSSQQLQNLMHTHIDPNMLEGSNVLNLHALEPMTAGGSSLTPSPSPGASRATASGQGAANRQIGLGPEPRSEPQQREEIARTPGTDAQSHSQQVIREEPKQPKKIEEDEILRLIHEYQEGQEWSESQSMYDSSQADTFHGRPRGITGGLGQGSTRGNTDAQAHGNAQTGADDEGHSKPHGRHRPTPSIIFGTGGEIYDEPKKAVYGIKKAKNAF